MSSNRIKISKEATAHLSIIKGRTGLTPNILCRIAFCLSLNEPSALPQTQYDETGQEFNRHTLTGEYDSFFVALLKERMIRDGLDPEKHSIIQFKGHLNRGVGILFSRVKHIGDLHTLLPSDADNKIKAGRSICH